MKLLIIACMTLMQLSTTALQDGPKSAQTETVAAPQSPPPRVVPNADDLIRPVETEVNTDGTFSPVKRKGDDSSPKPPTQDGPPVRRATLGVDTGVAQPQSSGSADRGFPWMLVGIIVVVVAAAAVAGRRLLRQPMR